MTAHPSAPGPVDAARDAWKELQRAICEAGNHGFVPGTVLTALAHWRASLAASPEGGTTERETRIVDALISLYTPVIAPDPENEGWKATIAPYSEDEFCCYTDTREQVDEAWRDMLGAYLLCRIMTNRPILPPSTLPSSSAPTPILDSLGELWWDMGEHDGDDCAVGIECQRKFQHPHFLLWIADSRKDRSDHSKTTALAEEIVSVLNAHRLRRSAPEAGGPPTETDEIRYPRTVFIDGKLTVTGYDVVSPEDDAENKRRLAEVEAGFYWTLLDGWMVPSEKLYERDKEPAYRFCDPRTAPAGAGTPPGIAGTFRIGYDPQGRGEPTLFYGEGGYVWLKIIPGYLQSAPLSGESREAVRLGWLLRNAFLAMVDDGDGSIGLFLGTHDDELAVAIVAQATGEEGQLTEEDAPWLTAEQRAKLDGSGPPPNGSVRDRAAILAAIDHMCSVPRAPTPGEETQR